MSGAIHQRERVDLGRSFETFSSVSSEYGAKAAGLLTLPKAWCPNFLALPVSLHQQWKCTGRVELKALDSQISDWLSTVDRLREQSVIVRSSGALERIGDRGKYLSVSVQERASIETIKPAIEKIFRHAKQIEPDESIGILLQQFLPPRTSGHLSNETRLSPTRNQWRYEVEKPAWVSPRGLNSKFAPMPDPNKDISCGLGIPHQSLRSVGRWVNDNVVTRAHMEWLANEGRLYVVQLDFEWAQHDVGIDPASQKVSTASRSPDASAVEKLLRYNIGDETPWKKLRNLNDFDFENRDSQPNIYQLPGQLVELASRDRTTRNDLMHEIDLLTGGRAVVRTDCKSAKLRSFNLPRTDTVSPATAVDWSIATLAGLKGQGIPTDDVVFLLHAFIPAYASAWAYSQPDSPHTIVDALWGLPDGLQVLPHDSYEVNVKRDTIVPSVSRYKPRFLSEESDGSWRYRDVLRSRGRSRVLQRRDILEIARRTSHIAQKLREDAQIMWFCGIPESMGIGRNLPWYRAREYLDQAPRVNSRYPPYDVRNADDLARLPDREAMIRLSPDANLIRDEKFLQKVIDVALEKRIPVELQGSLLGHTYYRFSAAGVAIVLAEAPKYSRVRERKTFGKLVRDSIPEGIKLGGEHVLEAVLEKSDILPALAGKLVEELEEFLRSTNPAERTAELADLLEVIRGLAFASKVNWADVEHSGELKRSKRGGFEQRRILLETSLPPPKSSTDNEQIVRLMDISHVRSVGNEIAMPISLLVTSIVGRPLTIKAEEPNVLVRFRIERGNLKIALNTQQSRTQDEEHQLTFDWNDSKNAT